MNQRIRTALYGGSFNPLHEGHLALGRFVIDHHFVEECWYVLSPQNPLKDAGILSDAKERFDQLKNVLSAHPGCFASALELDAPAPNYTVDTVKRAVERYPDRCFSLLIGADNLEVFTQWKDYEYLLEHHDILVYPRPGSTHQIPASWKRVQLLKAPMMDISSSQIRAQFSKK